MYLSTIPFVYLIGWTAHNCFYIGSRYAKGCNPKDLMVTYKTSSKYVKEFIEKHGDPDIIEIRKTFDSKKAAVHYEHKLLRRIDVANNSRFLNRWNSGTFINISHTFSAEHRKKMSEAKKKENRRHPSINRESVKVKLQSIRSNRLWVNLTPKKQNKKFEKLDSERVVLFLKRVYKESLRLIKRKLYLWKPENV